MNIASVLIQDEVPAAFSGALLTDVNGAPIIEGVAGYGDGLMIGSEGPIALPGNLGRSLKNIHDCLRRELGSIRVEWVFDGKQVWVLQLQQEAPQSSGAVIVDGDFSDEVPFMAEDGLESLRALTCRLRGKGTAIRLIGNVGITSHMADVLRRAGIPSRLVRR